MSTGLTLSVLPNTCAICRLDRRDPIPTWASRSPFFSITRTADELTTVCLESDVPEDVQADKGWKVLKVLDSESMSQVGVIRSLCSPLAEAGISLHAVSTCDAKYLILREKRLQQALSVLIGRGNQIV